MDGQTETDTRPSVEAPIAQAERMAMRAVRHIEKTASEGVYKAEDERADLAAAETLALIGIAQSLETIASLGVIATRIDHGGGFDPKLIAFAKAALANKPTGSAND
jgi:hypothetical protein